MPRGIYLHKSLSEETKKKISESCKKVGTGKWMAGRKWSKEIRLKMKVSLPKNKRHWLWKGDEVSYRALHSWVHRWLGKPKYCEFCGKTQDTPKSIHWANKSGKYLRDLNDWISLCVRCHKEYDLNLCQ